MVDCFFPSERSTIAGELIFLMDQTDKKPLIIAHRGASALAPENTLAAFAKAFEDEAEGIEFDVRLAKDAVAVVFHDADLRRIASAERNVSDLTSAELASFDIGSWFNKKNPKLANPEFSHQRIPTLEQTLDFLKNFRGVIYIELKCEDKEVEMLSKIVGRVIKNSVLLPQIIVKSFNLDVLPNIQKYCPAIKTAALFTAEVKTIIHKQKRLVNIAKNLQADFLSLHFSLATGNLMRLAELQNLNVAIWTADSPRWVKRSMKLGIRHIITNNPARLLEKRHRILQKNSILL